MQNTTRVNPTERVLGKYKERVDRRVRTAHPREAKGRRQRGKRHRAMARPTAGAMAALQKRLADARRKKVEAKETEEREQADAGPGAAFGCAQVARRELLREQAKMERENKAAAKKEEKEQAEKLAEEQLQAALRYDDQMEGIHIEKQVRKAVGKELEGTAYHTLVTFQFLKMLKAAASEWRLEGTSEIPPGIGVRVQLVVLRIPLDMSAVALYKALAGLLGLRPEFRTGIIDLPPVRQKKDPADTQTEGKHAFIAATITKTLSDFLTTGNGWDEVMSEADGLGQQTSPTLHIRRDRALWIKIARQDQSLLFFRVARLLQIPYREAVWHACQCLTECYRRDGHKVQFTTFEFSPTGRAEGGRPAPAADYYDQDVQVYAVVATEEHRAVVERAQVAKSLWFEPPRASSLQHTAWAVQLHFDYNWTARKMEDPVEQAQQDALQELHLQAPVELRLDDEEDYTILVTVRAPQQKLRQVMLDHYGGATRLGLVVANELQQHLLGAQAGPIGVGVAMRGDQVSLSTGVVLAVAGRQAGQNLLRQHQDQQLELIKGMDKTWLQFKVLSKAKAKPAGPGAGGEWTTVKRTSAVTKNRVNRLIQITGARVQDLKLLAARILAELEEGPMTMPGRKADGSDIPPGEQTAGLEQWMPMRSGEQQEDIRGRHDPPQLGTGGHPP